MPLQRRLPKIGFNRPQKIRYQIVNLDQLTQRNLSGDVTLEVLRESGLIRNLKKPVKVLGQGEVGAVVQLHVHAASQSARDKITQAGGAVHLVTSGTASASTAVQGE